MANKFGIVESPWLPIQIPHITLPNFILEKLHFHGDANFIVSSNVKSYNNFFLSDTFLKQRSKMTLEKDTHSMSLPKTA